MTIRFGIVTPTFERCALLRRHLRRIRRQSYSNWHLLVVHDGPSVSTRALVESFQASDSRIEYAETEVRAADAGATPRFKGIESFMEGSHSVDYLAFWDDDNLYAPDALERLAHALDQAGKPDLLLVGVKYGTKIIPPANTPIRSLRVGELDTACLIFRPSLARDAYVSVLERGRVAPEEVIHFNDFLSYNYANQMRPMRIMERDLSVIVCRHDDLRWGPFIRHSLRIPPLGVARFLKLGR